MTYTRNMLGFSAAAQCIPGESPHRIHHGRVTSLHVRARVLLVVVILGLTPLAARRAHGSSANASCPSSSVLCDAPGLGFDHITSTDSSAACSKAGLAYASYDLAGGSFVAGASMGPYCCPNASADAFDVYQITGLPPGGPLSFSAELTVHAGVSVNGCVPFACIPSAECDASIRDLASNQSVGISLITPASCVDGTCCGGGTVADSIVVLSLAHTEG